MFLVTTSDERTWKKSEKILFLGEWCKLYQRKREWENLDFDTVPYHWDDRIKYYNDYKYLSRIYEKYLKSLSGYLNRIHGLNYSLRYWRIVVGPWLRYFMDVILDRYRSIKFVEKRKHVSSTWIMESDITEWISKDCTQSFENHTSDAWNHLIYGEIIKLTGEIPYDIINKKNNPAVIYNKKIQGSLFKQTIRRLLDFYRNFLPDKFNQTVFISSYFNNTVDLIKLQLSMGQFPYPRGPLVQIEDMMVDINLRDQLKLQIWENEFEFILENLIQFQLPKTYLEGFTKLKNISMKKFPNKINGIYTANAYANDDGFKIWAAEQVEIGTKLFIGQHGGNMGTALWDQSEDHQIAIGDKYFSWGWKSNEHANVEPLSPGVLINLKGRIGYNVSGHVLCVLNSVPRYFYCSYSTSVAGQFLDYFNYQVELMKMLEPELLKIFRLRLASPDFGWDLENRFTDNGFGSNIEKNNINLLDRLSDCRLCVATNNGTVFLETFTANFPTILYWDSNYYEIRDSAKEYFNELEKVGILHHSSKSVSSLIKKIYLNPLEWWMKKEIQSAKNRFCKRFAYVNNQWKSDWGKSIKN